LLLSPLVLELGRSEVAQRRMDTLAHVHVIEESLQLPEDVGVIKDFGCTLQELFPPSREDLRPQPILPTDLGLVLDAGELFQHYPGLEFWFECSSL